MQAFEIPLTPVAQNFTIALSGKVYRMAVSWCEPSANWVLNINDVDDNQVVHGLPLVPYQDILGQLKYLGIEGMLVVQSSPNAHDIPDLETLGTDGLLFYVVP